jgi:hypothetical protein
MAIAARATTPSKRVYAFMAAQPRESFTFWPAAAPRVWCEHETFSKVHAEGTRTAAEGRPMTTLYLAAGITSVVGALVVLPVKGVR